jgi:hypothetical protein
LLIDWFLTHVLTSTQSKTLHDALKVILAYDDPEKRKKRDADRQLKLEMKKMQEEKEKQEQVSENFLVIVPVASKEQ